MEDREPEERAEAAPLEDAIDATSEGLTPEVDSTRESILPQPTPEAEGTSSEAPQAAAEAESSVEEETMPATAEAQPTGDMTAETPAATATETAAKVAPVAASEMRGSRMPQGEVPPGASTEPAWYVIHCYSGYENKVRHNLEQRIETMGMKDRIFDVVIPTQEEIEVREGKRRTVERHIFPGYVLVNMTLSEESWYVVRNTPGVTGFVGMGNLPTALRPEEVSQIVKRMEAEAPTIKVSFKLGERVRIIDGPFNDFRGTVADIDMERTKVRVMVSFFGRETPVELDFLQVEKA